MREIKFRAWDKDKKIMEFVGAIDWTANEKIITCNTSTQKHYSYQRGENVDFFVIMQYTGLKDKNGNEIYEGDIIEIIDDDDKKRNLEIIWNDPAAEFTVKYSFFAFESFNQDNMEVIGNIYEDPELLEVK